MWKSGGLGVVDGRVMAVGKDGMYGGTMCLGRCDVFGGGFVAVAWKIGE